MTYGKTLSGGMNPGEQDVNEAVTLEARGWVGLLLSGAATREDALALKAWRAADPRHETAFRQEGRLLRLAREAVDELRTEAAATPVRARKRLNRRMVIGGALAASAAGVVVITGREALPVLLAPGADFATGKGESRRVDLAGGVSVQLNTLTRIALRPELGAGAFQILNGEAVVDVAPRSAALAVVAEGGETRTSGGRLSFRCIGGEVKVSCLEGLAQVQLGASTATLQAQRSLTYANGALQAVIPIDPGVEAAWRQGLLIFRDRPLGDVIEEINRYREGRIIIADPRLGARRVNGAFHTARIDQIVDQIRLAYGVRATRLPGNVVLLA
ncbi:FecR family protein [Brevundimonas sp. GCM10030266]|uniref:FecR family protein n=1 Tax=Brevundimonas sp. GCM10030266 TaxID=3273386 RepID=UPI00360B695A